MKITNILCAAALTATPLIAGTVVEPVEVVTEETGFENARRPISNPTYFDLALPTTNIHPIFIYQNLPKSVNTTIGKVPLGGDFQVYALQFEIALNERISIVATKDGYVDFNPDGDLWASESGFANLAAGLKYAFYYNPASSTAFSSTVTFEIPTGDSDVFQGKGDGAVNLILSGVKLWDKFQLAGAVGAHLEFSDALADTGFFSAHASYEIVPWFIPLLEVNWHYVLDTGNGHSRYHAQAGGLVPAVAEFEGADLLNFGASHASENRSLVTAAVGFRSRVHSNVDIGFAYEIPLTNEDNGIIDNRFTVDLIWKF